MSVLDPLSCTDLPASCWSVRNTTALESGMRKEKSSLRIGHNFAFKHCSLPPVLGRSYNCQLFFWDHYNIPYTIKLKLIILSPNIKFVFFGIDIIHPEISVFCIHDVKKWASILRMMPRRTCIPITLTFSIRLWSTEVLKSLGRQRKFPFSLWIKSWLMKEQKWFELYAAQLLFCYNTSFY